VQEAKIFGRESTWKELVGGAHETSHVTILEIAGELIVAPYLKRVKDPAFSEERSPGMSGDRRTGASQSQERKVQGVTQIRDGPCARVTTETSEGDTLQEWGSAQNGHGRLDGDLDDDEMQKSTGIKHAWEQHIPEMG
jgi:hypothetical protein